MFCYSLMRLWFTASFIILLLCCSGHLARLVVCLPNSWFDGSWLYTRSPLGRGFRTCYSFCSIIVQPSLLSR
ncbi:hypothetical protein M438DRAFT_121568 [Aureobasidium pullulans EXF-150]|uniref:Uncharacterized protein n=1 Tax=Aureobasidium pullulans EXF-150 TaxID=1043002 RepID=A0A074X3G6_AURPU|nr:uncharacterized protein M438DRAFT_121568 [Aureobasidium pullulans EXF-150]KEQ80055.1 hypothetical protein M438DRAFT_121568 [Aureobasidium pullulans EXF-150]